MINISKSLQWAKDMKEHDGVPINIEKAAFIELNNYIASTFFLNMAYTFIKNAHLTIPSDLREQERILQVISK